MWWTLAVDIRIFQTHTHIITINVTTLDDDLISDPWTQNSFKVVTFMNNFRSSTHSTFTLANWQKYRTKFCLTVWLDFEAPTALFFTSSWPQSGLLKSVSGIWRVPKPSKVALTKFCQDFRSLLVLAGATKFCSKIMSTVCRLNRLTDFVVPWRLDFCLSLSKSRKGDLQSMKQPLTVNHLQSV